MYTREVEAAASDAKVLSQPPVQSSHSIDSGVAVTRPQGLPQGAGLKEFRAAAGARRHSPASAGSGSAAMLLLAQRAVGNRNVQRLVRGSQISSGRPRSHRARHP